MTILSPNIHAAIDAHTATISLSNFGLSELTHPLHNDLSCANSASKGVQVLSTVCQHNRLPWLACVGGINAGAGNASANVLILVCLKNDDEEQPASCAAYLMLDSDMPEHLLSMRHLCGLSSRLQQKRLKRLYFTRLYWTTF